MEAVSSPVPETVPNSAAVPHRQGATVSWRPTEAAAHLPADFPIIERLVPTSIRIRLT